MTPDWFLESFRLYVGIAALTEIDLAAEKFWAELQSKVLVLPTEPALACPNCNSVLTPQGPSNPGVFECSHCKHVRSLQRYFVQLDGKAVELDPQFILPDAPYTYPVTHAGGAQSAPIKTPR